MSAQKTLSKVSATSNTSVRAPRAPKKVRGALSKGHLAAALREIAIDRGHVYSYQIVLRPEPEGGYTVFVPSLPGCITYGRSLEEAHRMAEDAVRAYLLSREKHEETEPVSDKKSLISLVDVPLYR